MDYKLKTLDLMKKNTQKTRITKQLIFKDFDFRKYAHLRNFRKNDFNINQWLYIEKKTGQKICLHALKNVYISTYSPT